MRRSLYRHFIIGYILFGLLCFAVVSLFTSRITGQISLREAASRIYDHAMKIADTYSDLYIKGEIPSDFRDRLEGVQDFAGMRVWFVDLQGEISFDSEETDSLEGTVIDQFDPAATSRYYRIGTFYDCFSTDMLSVQAPITANLRTYGYVFLHTPLAEIHAMENQLLLPSYISALIVFGLSLIILILILFYIMRPLRKITEGASEYAAGNLRHTIDISRSDEIGYLADTLNLMASELASSEDYQKKFIANVSHDLRSPLTSIKGYLTAIIDGIIPPENTEKYLKIVVNETERLENLTQSMLSLNSLDRQNVNLERSNFDICLLIRGVCETFEHTCQQRGISFDLIFSDPSVYVYADLGKIQQVLYNLVDNAIKFSPDDSSISISVSRNRGKAFLSIRDSGIGISRKDQKQIWTRFFKGDSSRGKDKRGTGLGLSIVKEIINAHGEMIDVISTEGVGTEFIFSLPLRSGNQPPV